VLAAGIVQPMKKPPSPSTPGHFKGNKLALPSKPCATCGREMSWRRAWAKNWAEVKHCSDACRQQARRRGKGGAAT
jgi:hypothetical protein